MKAFEIVEQAERQQRMRMPVIPAFPGYVLLECCYDPSGDGERVVERRPIVGWRYDGDMALPITPDEWMKDSTMKYSAILCPDGKVVWPRCLNSSRPSRRI
jgi:hypothetical protein